MIFLFICLFQQFQIVVLFEIAYKSPDDEAGNFEPRHLVDPIQRQHRELHECQSDSIDDDQQKLLDIEQNIANLEKNLNRGKINSSDALTFYWLYFPFSLSLVDIEEM